MNNNPIRYNDPSGHATDDGCRIEGCGDSDKAENEYQKKRDYYEQCKENPDLPGCPDWVEITAFFTGSLLLAGIAIPVASVMASVIATAVSSLLASTLTIPMLVNAALGAITSMVSYGLMTSITGGQTNIAGYAGAAVGGAIAGAIGTVAAPAAGSILNGLGMQATNEAVTTGIGIINSLGGAIAYFSTSIISGNDLPTSLKKAAFGGAASGGLAALLGGPDLNALNAMRTISVASHFMPGQNWGTVFINNNSRDMLSSTFIEALLGGFIAGP
jgi:hypothetical protein